MRRSPSRPVRPSALRNEGRQVRFVVDEIDAGQALNRGRSPTRRGTRAGEAEVGLAGSPGGDGDAGDQRAGRERGRLRRTPRGRRRGGSGSSVAPSQPPAAPGSGRDSSRTRAGESGVAPNRGRETSRDGGRQHQPGQHGASAQAGANSREPGRWNNVPRPPLPPPMPGSGHKPNDPGGKPARGPQVQKGKGKGQPKGKGQGQGQKSADPGRRQDGNRPPSQSRSPRRDHPQKHR